jgi:phage antirepressor YoqD-like protein
MNALVTSIKTMSSVEIAELTGKRHDHVMTDIEKMLDELEIRSPEFSGEQTFANNRKRKIYNLPKRECLILVSGYNIQLRTKIIDRWQELETQVQQPTLNPTNMSRLQLLEMAMQAEQERLALEHQVQEMQPKVEALDRLSTASGSMCITDAAKSLQMKPSVLFKWLNEHGWIYRRVGGSAWIGYSEKITVGYLEHKVTVIHRDDGSEKVINQVLITPKGLIRLSQIFNSKQDAA